MLIVPIDKCTLSCEVLKNIRPDEELVATLFQDDKLPPSSSSTSSPSSSSSLPALSISSSVSSSVDCNYTPSIKVEPMEIDRCPSPSTAGRGAGEVDEEEKAPDNAAFLPSMASNAAAAAAAVGGSVQWDSLPSLLKHRGERRASAAVLSSYETAETEAERQRPTFCECLLTSFSTKRSND